VKFTHRISLVTKIVDLKNSFKIIVICLFIITFIFSCAKKESKRLSVQSSIRVEASFFRSNCVLCHGKEAEGGMIAGKAIPSLRTGDAVKKTDQEIYDQIANGKNGMPPFKYQLTEPQIHNMVRFIRDLQKEDF
jgi:mono/diheme cytochrome c family protein